MEITMTKTAFEEMIKLAGQKFNIVFAEGEDGIPMYLAKKDGLVRQFPVLEEDSERVGMMLRERDNRKNPCCANCKYYNMDPSVDDSWCESKDDGEWEVQESEAYWTPNVDRCDMWRSDVTGRGL